MIDFSVRLGDAYWSKGFFNVSVDFQRHFTMNDGAFDVYLGNATKPIIGRISRSANANATPRIFGNKALAGFFQEHFKRGDFVSVEVLAPAAVRIRGHVGHASGSRQADHASSQPTAPRVVTRATPRLESPSPKQSGSEVHIHDLYGHLARFCERLWKRQQKAPVPGDFASLISGLQRQNLVPSIEAGMMHTVRTVRNSHVHEHRRLGPPESQAVRAAWEVITQWAEREHDDLWKSSVDLP